MPIPGQNPRNPKDPNRGRYRTPPWLFRLLDEEFHFTLDAASDDTNHLCTRYLTEAENALEADWTMDRTFCNPPFDPVIPWARKFAETSAQGGLVVAVLPLSPDTSWSRMYVDGIAAEARMCDRRVQYLDPLGRPTNKVRGLTLVAVYHPRRHRGMRTQWQPWNAHGLAQQMGLL